MGRCNKVSNNASETNGLTSHVDSFIANSLQITDSSALGALINGKIFYIKQKLYSNGLHFGVKSEINVNADVTIASNGNIRNDGVISVAQNAI